MARPVTRLTAIGSAACAVAPRRLWWSGAVLLTLGGCSTMATSPDPFPDLRPIDALLAEADTAFSRPPP